MTSLTGLRLMITLGSNATLKATVDTFTAYLECEDASLTVVDVSQYVRVGSEYSGEFTLNYTSPTCTAAGVPFNTGPNYIFDALSPRNESHDITFGFAQLGMCEEPDEHRMLLSAGTIHLVEHWNGSEYGNIGLTLPWDQMLRITNSTNLLCTPHYRIAKSDVVKKYNATSGDAFESITQSDEPEGQAELALNLARGIFNSIYSPISAAQGFYALGSQDLTLPDSFFQLMTQEPTPPRDSASASKFWLEPENLRQYTNLFYGSLAAQVAAQNFLTPTSATVLGSVTVNEPRLFVSVLSFVLVEVCLVTLALIAVLLMYCTLRPFVNHDPGAISGIAAILAESPELCELITKKGSLPMSTFESELGEHLYHTRPESKKRMGIEVSRTSTAVEKLTSAKDAPDSVPQRWWRPMSLTTAFQLLTVLAPLAYIVVVEVLFTTSQSRGGLTGVDLSSWTHYGWTYLPALAMVCLKTLYTSVAFKIRLLSPYATMKASSSQASVSVSDHPLSRIALHEVFVTARRRQFGVLAVTIAALLAPFLTIAVSGLYTPEHYHQEVAIRQMTTWNFNKSYVINATLVQNAFDQVHELNPTNYSNGIYTEPFADLIVTANLSYPQWTFDELAFPLLQLENQTTSSAERLTPLEGTLDLPLSAIRGVLNCSVIPKENVVVTYATWESYPSAIYNETVEWGMAGNRQCLNFTPETGYQPNNGIFLPWPGCRMALFSTTSTYAPGGCTIAPRAVFLPPNTNQSQAFGYFQGKVSLDQYASYYCPWFVGMIGTINSKEIEDYTYFSCTTDVESVDTQTTITLPGYSISTVQIDETSSKLVKSQISIDTNSGTSGTHAHYINVTGPNTAMYSKNIALDPNGYLTNYNITSGQNYDNFFSALVSGRDGVPASEMMGEANIPHLLSAVQHLWRIFIAQQFRTNEFIISADPEDIKRFAPPQPLNATFMDLNAYRLRQSEVSTRILQGLLAALSLCAIVGFLLTDNRAVLPRNPCSIAAVASLLAGSEMLHVMANNMENDLDEQHRWDGYFFSLGMWPLPGAGKRFGIDVGKAEKATTQPTRRGGGGSWAVLRGKIAHCFPKKMKKSRS